MPRARRGRAAGAWLALLVLVGAMTLVRVRAALGDPGFDAHEADGILKSDPALLVYITERIVDAGGLPPVDFRADPRVEHPRRIDLPHDFTVGQEFLAAWGWRLHRALGGTLPLHVFCLWLMGLLASLASVGVYGLALEVTGSRARALGAALFCACLPASYRTIGFVLVREDLSLPLFAVHLWLAARAARCRSSASFVLAGLALGAALATWHALRFFVALEALALLAVLLATGRNALAVPRAWLAPAVAALVALAVPALRARHAALAPAFQIAGALLLAVAVARRMGAHGSAGSARVRYAPRAVALAAWAALALLAYGISSALGGGLHEDGHVFAVLREKLLHLGRLPDDPRALSFDARLMWQGPFATLTPGGAWFWLGVGLVPLLAVPLLARRPRSGVERALVAGVLLALFSAWLIERTVVLAALLAPVCAVALLARLPSGPAAAWVLALAIGAQGLRFAPWIDGFRSSWYEPAGQRAEIREVVAWIERNLPADAAIATDFVNGPAVLRATLRPILFQPKYDTRESRARVGDFLLTLFHESPEALRRLLVERYRCRYLLVDRYTLWSVARYAAGVPWSQSAPDPGTAAAALVSQDAEVLSSVPGYELLYRSPEHIRQRNGAPYDLFRLYRLAEDPPDAR